MGADDHALVKLSPIVDKLLQRGYRFSFFQAVYILEKVHGDSVPPGVEGPLSQEMIRFRARPELSFPATSITRIEKIADRNLQMGTRNPETIQMILSFMGLYGVNSPLPQYFSQLIVSGSEEMFEGDGEDDGGALRKFLDIFDHRIYSFFYRSWKKYKYHLQFESGARDRFSKYMLSFFGLGTPALPDLAGIAADRLIPYAGILGQQSRCTASLQRMISDYFGGIAVKIREFIPRWVDFPEEYQPQLGTDHAGIKARLDENATIGERVRDFNSKFQIVLGPLDPEMFRKFLPGESHFQDIYHLVRFYVSDKLLFDLNLLMRKEDATPLQLDSESEYLGWNSWLDKPDENIVSVIFSFEEESAVCD